MQVKLRFGQALLAAALGLRLGGPGAMAQAPTTPTDWCASVQGPDGGYVSCGYVSYDQCVAALSGIGGVCHPNPQRGGTAPRTPSGPS